MMTSLAERYSPIRAPEGPSGGGASSPPGPASSPSAPSSHAGSSTPSAAPSSSTTVDGGAPTKTAPPTTVDSSPESSKPASEGFDFESIFSGSSEPVAPPTPVTPEAVQPQPPAAAPGTPQQPQAQAAQPTAPQAPVGASPQATPQAAQARHLDPADPVALAHALQEHEADATAHIAQAMFQLSREDIEAMESDIVGTIPKLLARSFVKSQLNMLQQLGRIVPQMMGRQIEALRANQANENKFYARWPQLRGQDLVVRRIAATYRQMNPAATLEQMIEELGPLVALTSNVQLAPQTPMTPATQTPRANGARAPQPSPFVPAVGGPGGGNPQQSPAQEAWEAMFTNEG